jgi:hypothetical protein
VDRTGPLDYDDEVRRHDEVLAAHLSDNGVRLDSRAWIVTARRR